jgi:hypothetical protein
VEKRLQSLLKEMPDLLGPYEQLDTTANAQIVNGFLRIERFKRVPTKESYAGSLEITVVARTQKNNIRLYAHQGGMLIFNWEGKPGTLHIHRPDSPRGAGTGAFVREIYLPLEPNVWHTLRWRIFPRGMDLVVDNKPAVPIVLDSRVYDLRAAQPVEIGAWDSVVEVKSFRVRPIK